MQVLYAQLKYFPGEILPNMDTLVPPGSVSQSARSEVTPRDSSRVAFPTQLLLVLIDGLPFPDGYVSSYEARRLQIQPCAT